MPELIEAVKTYLEQKPVVGVPAPDLVEALSVTAPVTFRAGEVLLPQGGTAHALFFLLQGSVRICRRDRSGAPREIALIHAPAFMGHVALLDHAPRSASCHCETDVRVMSLDQVTCDRMIAEATPRGAALRRVLCASLSRSLTRANGQVAELFDLGVETERVGGTG